MRKTQCVCLMLFALGAGLRAQTAATTIIPTVAYVYAGENTSPQKIAAFAVKSNGSIATVSGSPFTARGESIAVTSGYLFGTDGTYITTYARNSSGGLHAASTISGIAHNDTPTGSGAGSLTLDHTGKTLYAAEFEFQGADNNSYAAFNVGSGGALKFQSNAGISVDYGGVLQFSPNNLYAYSAGCYFADWQLNALHRASSGALTAYNPAAAIPSVPNNNDVVCPGETAVSAKGYLAVLYYDYATGGTMPNIALYRITSSGDLVMTSGFVVANNLQALNAGTLRFDPTGKYLVVAGNGIEMFSVNANGTLARLGDISDSSIHFTDVKWDNTDHVYAISATSLQVFTWNGSVLKQIGAKPLSKAVSLAVLPVH